jgi:hypothetical protein
VAQVVGKLELTLGVGGKGPPGEQPSLVAGFGFEVDGGQCPVIQPWPLGAVTTRQTLPRLRRGAGDQGIGASVSTEDALGDDLTLGHGDHVVHTTLLQEVAELVVHPVRLVGRRP